MKKKGKKRGKKVEFFYPPKYDGLDWERGKKKNFHNEIRDISRSCSDNTILSSKTSVWNCMAILA